MEYNPRYPQPFTLTQAIALDPAVACDEIARLRNSLLHLRRTQDELQEYLRELAPEEQDLEVTRAVKENDITIASQDERILILKLALTHHGHSIASDAEHTLEPPTASRSTPFGGGTQRSRSTFGSNEDGLGDLLPVGRTSAVDHESSETEGQESGVYL